LKRFRYVIIYENLLPFPQTKMGSKERKQALSLKETLKELLTDPEALETFILQPRSTDGYRWLRFQALELVHDSIFGLRLKSSTRPTVELLTDVCLKFGVLDGRDLEAIKQYHFSEVVHRLDQVTVRRRPIQKIWGLKNICEWSSTTRRLQDRVGWIQGTWRFGALHEGYQHLITDIRTCLGPSGLLIVGVDSDEMVKSYKPSLPFIPLKDRISSLASLPLVDLVVALRPGRRQRENLDEYVARVWRKIRPHIIFIGARDHPLFDRSAVRAREAGAMLLWHEETQKFTTEERVRLIRGEPG
jgi:glycerol-3-phosphate cytidylyltransferase-like family protein